MKGSSKISNLTFGGLTMRRALALVESLQRSKLRTEPQIRKVFSQHSECFDVALAFLIRLGVVRKRGGVLALRTEPPLGSTSDRQAWLFSLLLSVRNRYRSEIFSYLRKYRIEGGGLTYRPLVQQRSRESDVRNFLMEIGVVRYDEEGERYVLSSDYVYVYACATETRREISPDILAKSIAMRDEIGLSAEREVMDFEKNRLGPALEGKVDHVALRNVAAGYDIRSLTVNDRNEMVPRYIEVKAVSPSSMCFYWTHNEMGVAQVLKESYFLYLVPVRAIGEFDLSNLKIISDPHKVMLESPNEWVIETDVIRCSLRKQWRAPHYPTGVLQHV